MFGFRADGRRIGDIDPIVQITPYLMPMRCDAQVFLQHEVDYEMLTRYIAKKLREDQRVTFMQIIVAAYVRSVSQHPEINRFIMNKQYYSRNNCTVSFTMLKDPQNAEAGETAVKIKFDPTDTLFDVRDRMVNVIDSNRGPGPKNFADRETGQGRVGRYQALMHQRFDQGDESAGVAARVSDPVTDGDLLTQAVEFGESIIPARLGSVGGGGVDDGCVAVYQLRRLDGRGVRQAEERDIRSVQDLFPGCFVLSQLRREAQDLQFRPVGQTLMNPQAGGAGAAVYKNLCHWSSSFLTNAICFSTEATEVPPSLIRFSMQFFRSMAS